VACVPFTGRGHIHWPQCWVSSGMLLTPLGCTSLQSYKKDRCPASHRSRLGLSLHMGLHSLPQLAQSHPTQGPIPAVSPGLGERSLADHTGTDHTRSKVGRPPFWSGPGAGPWLHGQCLSADSGSHPKVTAKTKVLGWGALRMWLQGGPGVPTEGLGVRIGVTHLCEMPACQPWTDFR
jgi:hypothetical protein